MTRVGEGRRMRPREARVRIGSGDLRPRHVGAIALLVAAAAAVASPAGTLVATPVAAPAFAAVAPRSEEPGSGSGSPVDRAGDSPIEPAARYPAADDATVLVRLAPGTPPAGLSGLAPGVVLGARPVPGTSWTVVDTPPGAAATAAAALAGTPGVREVAPNLVRRAFAAPNDPYWPLQEQYLGPLRVERAWERAGQGTGVTVAVLDTGVDLDHPDLIARLVLGYDVVNGDPLPDDDNGHGTLVAGIVAATPDNGRGIAGVAGAASIMPVKVLDSGGNGDDATIASGITWAVDNGADIVNLSLGGPGASQVLEEAVAYANAADVLVVAAAGNTGDGTPQVPAAIPAVVAVGATGDAQDAARFSTRGWWVDVAAPGIAIVTTRWGLLESYSDGATGTSFATPIVSGVAALVRSHQPGLTQAQVARRLRATARDRGPHGIDTYFGFGVIDALGAVNGPRAAPAPSFPKGPTEPNDRPARAHAFTSSVDAAIAPEGDTDWYSRTFGPGTWKIAVSRAGPSDSLDPRGLDPVIEVFRPGGRRIARSSGSAVKGTEAVRVDVAARQTLLVRIANALSARSPSDYTLWVRAVGSGGTRAGAPPPWIHRTTPPDRRTGVGTQVSPTIEFGRDIHGPSITASTVWLLDGVTGRRVLASRSFVPSTDTLVIDPRAPLAPGPYVVRLSGVRDRDGRLVADESFRFTVGPRPDTTPPETTITSAPASPTSAATVSFSFASIGAVAFECRIDTGPWNLCSSPFETTVAPGDHTFAVFARDAAGNEDPTPATATWTYTP
jgi:serine protease